MVKIARFKNAYDQELIAIGAHRVMPSTLPLGGPHPVPALRETRRTVSYEQAIGRQGFNSPPTPLSFLVPSPPAGGADPTMMRILYDRQFPIAQLRNINERLRHLHRCSTGPA